MKPSTKDQIQGKLHEIKGKAKEKGWDRSPTTPIWWPRAKARKSAGVIQKKVGQIEKVLEK